MTIDRPLDDDAPAWTGLTLGALTEHIEEDHHGYLRAALPRLVGLGERVVAMQGSGHAATAEVLQILVELCADLEDHLEREEQVVFPLIRAQDHATGSAFPLRPEVSVTSIIATLLGEHDVAGDRLRRLRDLTGGYVAPPDGRATLRLFSDGLADLASDLDLHVHKEGEVLFPRAVERERALLEPGERSDGGAGDYALTIGECWAALETGTVGRLAVARGDGDIDVFPVNYAVDEIGIVFVTGPGSKLDRLFAEPRCSFEADGADFYDGTAWSVVAMGRPEPVRATHAGGTDAGRTGGERSGPTVRPWQPGPKPIAVRLVPDRLTGRRFPIDPAAGYSA